MNGIRPLSYLLLASLFLCISVARAQEASPPTQASAPLSSEGMTHEAALGLYVAEAEVMAYVRTCVEQQDRQAFFLKLSDRYRQFLAFYARLSAEEMQTPAPPSADPIDCTTEHEKVLQSIRDREASIQHLLSEPPPVEPAVVGPPKSEPVETKS